MGDFHTFYVVLQKIKREWSETSIKNLLCTEFSIFFVEFRDLGTLNVKVYKDKGIAVISGISLVFNELAAYAAEKEVEGKKLEFQWDFGDARNELGFVQARPSKQVISEKMLKARTFVDLQVPFTLNFKGELKDLNLPLCLYERKIAYENRFVPYYEVAGFMNDKEGDRSIIRYKNVLQAIQSILYFNGEAITNDDTNKKEVIKFCSIDNTWICPPVHHVKLGAYDFAVDFHHEQHVHQYVPLSDFNPDVVDIQYYKAINIRCDKCQTNYKVIGMDKNLEFLAAKCECHYEWSGKENPEAIKLRGEKFTRLIGIISGQTLSWAPLSLD